MIAAIIQARMGSSRLPNKVLMDIQGKPSLEFMIERVLKSKYIEKIIVATTTTKKDKVIVDFCKNKKIAFYCGSENDVLDRYYQASKKNGVKTIVRLTSDCPLIDPYLIDKTIDLYFKKFVNYASNAVPPELKKYPDGSDVEVFSFTDLTRAWIETKDIKDREHVTFYFWKRNKNFKTAILDNKHDWGKYRITVDYKEDIDLVRKIVKKLEDQKKFGTTKEIIQILESNSNLLKLNSMHSWGSNW
jgi:spore coat polysaccharide biosynthesis protein SpsF